ncbi:MAG: pyruvate kinase [Selenomonadaceae bacterium]|nr:pyruvate kinase [Selenomonadaceae bacterium]
MRKKTKIICTMGPATERDGVLDALIAGGMNCARFNFSHGTHEEQAARIDAVRKTAAKKGAIVSLLLDTKGPEMRLGEFAEGKVELKKGSRFVLTADDAPGDATHVSVNHKGLYTEVKPGDTLLLSDGLVELKVEAIEGKDIVTTVQNDGPMSTRKRVAAPGVALGLPPISEQDEKDIIFGVEQGMDFVAASFIQRAEDVRAIRALIAKHGGHMEILSKIENLEGVKNFDAILEETDGVMVARGDLGVEIPAEDVPLIQKEIIAKCNRAGKPVIVATQMLESMTANPRPTRAEASDVANAILDGTDAIMLSGETASGDYPKEALETMARIAERTERALSYREIIEGAGVERHKTTEAIAHATVQLAYEVGAKLIITPTASGYTTRMVSKYRPKAEIFAFTPSEEVARHLNLRWGVEATASPRAWKDAEEMLALAATSAKTQGLIASGDRAVVTSGIKVAAGNTNAIRVYTIE